MSFKVVYEPARTPATGPTPGARALMAACLALYPPATNSGIYNPRDQRGTKALSLHAEGRAIDVGYPAHDGGHPSANRLASDLVRLHAELGVQCVIYNRRIWSTTKPTWRKYTGTDGHTGHLHIELNRAAAAALTSAAAIAALKPQETPGMPPLSARDTPVGLAQQAINGWLPEHLRIAVDGEWGDKSTQALLFVLDEVAGPTLKALETANASLTETNVTLHARVTDLLAQINANRAGAGVDARTVALATIGAKTLEWVDTVTTERDRINGAN